MGQPSGRAARAPGAHHHLSAFKSGNAGLDDWLRRHAVPAQEVALARTFVPTENDRVVNYFSSTMGASDAPTPPPSSYEAYLAISSGRFC